MSSIKILDAAMGTELIGLGCTLPDHVWSAHINITNPNLICEIHKKHIASGSKYITTNTFRTTSRAFIKAGYREEDAKEKAKDSLINALKMAHMANKDKNIKILGSIAPLEDCYIPENYPGSSIAHREFSEIAENLSENNIDGFLLETMNSIPETVTCLEVVKKFNLPIWVSFNLLDDKHILSGESIQESLKKISKYQIEALLLNCNSIKDTSLALPEIRKYWSGIWGIYPNIGMGKPSPDGIIENYASMDAFMGLADESVKLGATILGGCCGSTSDHIEALRDKFI